MPDKKYRVGLIGTGRKGTQHARAFALNPASEIVAAADPDPTNLNLFRERFGLAENQVYADYHEMLAAEELDIVAPILPVKFNPDAVVAAAESGVRAIICEKPVSATLADADRMVEACRANNVKFGAGDMFRNLAQIGKAREVIESGEIGDVQSINYYGSADSGGGCQTLSMLRFFAGDADIDWVVGWTNGTPMDSSLGTVDAWSDHDQQIGGIIRFANGITAHIHDKQGVRQGVEVVCENGVFASDYTTFQFYKRPDRTIANRLNWSDLEEIQGLLEPALDFGPWQEDGWLRMSDRQADTAQSMIDALDEDIEPRATGDNGRIVLELSIALRESERRGFSPVKLPLEDRTLQIIPAASRMLWKKEVYGEEWYAEQMTKHKKDSRYGV